MFVFAVFGVYTLTFVFSSFLSLKTHKNKFNPKVSVIIPCKNEEDVILKTLDAVRDQDYEDLEVIVIDDNSEDNTAAAVENFIDSYKLNNFKLLKRKEKNSKKAKAVNDGLKHVKGDITVFFDADNSPERHCITNLVKRFSDDRIASVQGKIVTHITNFVSRIVFMERCSGFNVRFLGKEKLGMNSQFGGTAVAIRTKILRSIGGFDEETLTEDTNLTSNLILKGYKIVYEPNALVTEEAPPNLNNYITQRTRWASGHMKCFFEYASQVFKAPISLKDKLDTLIFLAYYFVPILCGFAILIGLISVYFNINLLNHYLCIAGVIMSLIPFLEILIGVLRSEHKFNVYLLPSLAFFFVLNVVICFNAIFNILCGKNMWIKTERVETRRKTGKDVQVTMFSSLLVCLLLLSSFGSTVLNTQDVSFAENTSYAVSNLAVSINLNYTVAKNSNLNSKPKHEIYKDQTAVKSNKLDSCCEMGAASISEDMPTYVDMVKSNPNVLS